VIYLLELPHAKVSTATLPAPSGPTQVLDLRCLKSPEALVQALLVGDAAHVMSPPVSAPAADDNNWFRRPA